VCAGLSKLRRSPDPVQVPSPDAGRLNLTQEQPCITPQLLMLAPGTPSLQPPSLASDSPPAISRAPSHASFDFNFPPELSQSPPTTTASLSCVVTPLAGPPPLLCHHCHISLPDVASLVYVPLACLSLPLVEQDLLELLC